ncbi:type II secretion system minor pseudopilin GspJ [Microbulbifer marinus]|uniref:Type II secretion system protein J n=1 Tax=Microbulbifer marinus TaxID=658218 RepID=A0A1H3VZQ8_9GAMM|nr:type II secretion system minor pseudopilin GspJ [Microbulbifer marinus]SDZ80220.1 general secretion pathway protein J [Microbulbifer marinus]
MRFSLCRRQSGFTLIEILVVLMLVAIISIGSFALLDTFNSTDRELEVRAEELRRFSMAMYRIDDDLRQLTARAVKNGYNGYEPALRGDADEVEFTRLGAANLTGEPRGELQRLSYSIGFADEAQSGGAEEDSGGLLIRSRWRVLDRAPDSEPVAEPLLPGVDSLSLRYYDPDTEAWLSQWPPVTSRTGTAAAETRLPQALELVLVTRSGGELRRVFPLPRVSVTAGGGNGNSAGGDEQEGDDGQHESRDETEDSDGSEERGGRDSE